MTITEMENRQVVARDQGDDGCDYTALKTQDWNIYSVWESPEILQIPITEIQ